TVGVLMLAMVKNVAPTDLLFVGASMFFAVAGIITTEEALSGFANPGVLTVGALFVVAAGLRETGFLDYLGHHVLGRVKTAPGALLRLTGVVVPLSAFLNNTPIVAMFMPIVIDWCRRQQVSPSRLLIPLSYLTILGGTCTLIGTSTNLVVNDLMVKSGLPAMSLFELSWIGIPYAITGILYLSLFSRRLLPDRRELFEQLGESRREYLTEMQVQSGCRLAGQTVEQAGLRQLNGLFLMEIERAGKLITPVGPDEVIDTNDRLVFTGIVGSIVELERIAGLQPLDRAVEEMTAHQRRRSRMCEAVISERSPLVGKTVRDSDFRALYGAVVVAVHRSGSRLERKIGDIVLQPGDTLLLQTGPHFERAHRNDPAFYLISDLQDWRPLRRERAWIAAILLAVLIALMATELIPTVVAAMGVAVLMIALGCISASEGRNSIEWQVLLTIAAAYGVGAALENSGAARHVAELVKIGTTDLGPVGALAAIYLITSLVTELITNNAAAVLMFPFCLEIARQFGVDPRPMVIALTLAASASFMTPIGYQTNMMVYGPGGYRFSDFLRIGAPLHAILVVIAVVLVPRIWGF
ncbi:MAG: SLC13 family permease, partial [Planctomycetaceae bacterium]|nr:SLC13 family permease [Planctomycetaceae bacterium]